MRDMINKGRMRDRHGVNGPCYKGDIYTLTNELHGRFEGTAIQFEDRYMISRYRLYAMKCGSVKSAKGWVFNGVRQAYRKDKGGIDAREN